VTRKVTVSVAPSATLIVTSVSVSSAAVPRENDLTIGAPDADASAVKASDGDEFGRLTV
jgi:hypothetical protein